MKLYALKDVKMGTYGSVMMAQNDAHMSRLLDESLKGQNVTPAKYPGDFELFQVGEFAADGDGSVHGELRFVCGLSVILSENGGSHA